jgi:hypothetical protein
LLFAVVHPIGFRRVAKIQDPRSKIEGKDDRTEYEYAMETMNGTRALCGPHIVVL